MAISGTPYYSPSMEGSVIDPTLLALTERMNNSGRWRQRSGDVLDQHDERETHRDDSEDEMESLVTNLISTNPHFAESFGRFAEHKNGIMALTQDLKVVDVMSISKEENTSVGKYPLGTTFSLVFNLVSGRYGGAEKLREILKLRREEISGKGTGLTIKNDPSRKGRRVRQEKPTSVQRQIAGSAGGPMIPSISLVAGGVGNGTEESGGQSLGRIGGSIENTEIDPSLPASMAEIDLIPPFPFPLDAISFDPTKTTLQPSNQSAITSTIPAFPSTSQTPWNLSSAEKRPIGRPKGVKNKSHVPVEEVKEKRRIAQIKRREKQRAERVRLGLEVGEVESSERAGEVDLAATRGRKRGRPRKYRPEEEEGGMGGQYTQFEGDEDLGRPQLGERGGEENAHLTLQDGQHIGEEDMMAYPQQIIPGESQHADDGGMQDLQTLATQHHHGLDNIDVAQLQAMGDVAGIEEMQAGMQQYTNDEQDHQHHAVMQGDINMMDLPPLQEGGEEMHQRHPEMTDEEAGIMQYVHDYTITLDALERARATLVDEGQQQHVTGEQE